MKLKQEETLKDHILRRPQVRDDTGMSDSQIDRLEKSGEFPKRRQITKGTVGWSYCEIQAWVNERLHGGADQTDLPGGQ
jgi:predicted DNA-binding transcriptional regulator AlpA